jgi:acetyltransferase-like isoleucine patch superfamily enzyme
VPAYDPRHARFETHLVEPVQARHLATRLGGELIGPDLAIHSVATYAADRKGSLSFQVGDPPTCQELQRVVLCAPAQAAAVVAATRIVVDDPRAGFLDVLAGLQPDWVRTTREQFEVLGLEAGRSDIHPSAVIEDGVVIGARCTIEPGVVVKRGTVIGHDSHVSAHSVLGTHGPSLYKTPTRVFSYLRLHVGTLQVMDHVEVGNACVVLKGMLGRTLVGHGSVLGNMVHIGHGCEIRDHVWMAASVTVCGHAVVDAYASIGAGSVIRDNVRVGAHASVGMGSVVVGDVADEVSVLGVPARETQTRRRSGPDR